jgi:glycerophosphoryl diester phosphodiesterase
MAISGILESRTDREESKNVKIRRLAPLAAVLAAFCLPIASSSAQEPQIPAPNIKIAGHRGATKNVDENTIKAMAYAHPYADILETDVQLTSDGLMVIMHDGTLDRTTSCTGAVSKRTLAYIKRCRTARGDHPPSLRQLLQWADAQPDEIEFHLELKGTWTQAKVNRFVNEATNYSMRYITATSFSEANLDKVARANDALPDSKQPKALARSFNEGGNPTQTPFRICDHYEGYSNSLSYLKPTYVDELQKVCNPPTTVAVYGGLDTAADYQAALDTGAWILTVEDPKDARTWLNNR